MGVSPQVIYKKFNIPCPLDDDDHHNMTSFAHDLNAINGTDDFCEAKLFTVNSQVREKHFHTACVQFQLCVYYVVSTADSLPMSSALERVMSTVLKHVMSTATSGIKQVFDCVPQAMFCW